jgi:tripartite-type tricarboxylate transporter receptor subunit TctC
MTSNRRFLLGLLASAAAARPWGGARAASPGWKPSRAVRYIVPVAPGGSQDVVARLIARGLTEELGQPVQVENLAGGGSNIGYEAAARAAADGHTLLAGSDTLSINASLYPRLPFDALGFTPVHRSVAVPQIFVVKTEHPSGDLRDWLRRHRADTPAVGTPGNGSLAHLLSEVIQRASETRWTHVPYRGGALALNDLLAGHLQGVMINIGAVTEHVRAGRLRGLAVSSAERALAVPDAPTLIEEGFQGLSATGWHGLVLPPGSEPAVALAWNAAARRAVARPEIAPRLAALGVVPQDEAPEQLARVISEDAARWAEVVRRNAIRPD